MWKIKSITKKENGIYLTIDKDGFDINDISSLLYYIITSCKRIFIVINNSTIELNTEKIIGIYSLMTFIENIKDVK